MESRRAAWLLTTALCACPEADPPLNDDAGAGGDDDAAARPDFAIRYTTDHVDIAPGFTQPICRGALDEIDRHMDIVAELLDIDVQARPTFYWFNEHAEGALADNDESCNWCRNGCDCTTAGGKVIYSDANSMFHELTHAVVTPAWGRSDVIFSEGIAHGLDGGHVVMSRPVERPTEFAGGTRHGGAHFSRWLVDRFGPAKFRELFPPRLGVSSTKEEVFAAVEAVYGLPFPDLEAEYFATAPVIYPAPGLCDGLPHVPWQGDRWELHATPDCDSPNVFGPRDEDAAMTVSVTLDLPELLPDHWLAVDVLPDLGGTYGTVTPCIDEPVYDEDDPMSFIFAHLVASRQLLGPRAGRYRLTMPLPESGELVVRICPWNGEWPQAGEPPQACLDD